MMQVSAITEQLIEQIKQSVFLKGDKLPSERHLSDSFGCNRLTIQEALAYLEALGYIYSQKRKGWFIAETPLPLRWIPGMPVVDFVSRYGALETVKSELSLIKATAAPAVQAKVLGIAPLSPVYQIERIHYRNNNPIMVSVHYCPQKQFPKLNKLPEEMLASSLYLTYQHHYHRLLIEKQLFVASYAFPELIAAQLQASRASRALLLTHLIYDNEASAIPVELCYEYWRAHAIQLDVAPS